MKNPRMDFERWEKTLDKAGENSEYIVKENFKAVQKEVLDRPVLDNIAKILTLTISKETMISTNNALMSYFDNWLTNEKKKYKPKLKETKEHVEAIKGLFLEMMEEAEREAGCK